MGKLTEKLVYVLLLAIIGLSGTVLFFEDSLTGLVSVLKQSLAEHVDNSGRVLKIGYLFPPKDLNPWSTDQVTQSRLLDVYEGLVSLDENLLIRPALAVSYGLVGEKEWHFHLRDGVKFHNGKELDISDVIYSLEQAKFLQTEFAENVEKIKEVGQSELIILTKRPDPLLLNKLAKIAIVPVNFTDFSTPVGTGVYQVSDSSDLADISYQRNANYWSNLAYFPNLHVMSISGKDDRVSALKNGQIDFLVNVPPDAANEIVDAGYELAKIPSLEVGFVMFNLKDDKLSSRSLRLAVAQALNKDSFLDLAYGFAKVIDQFIPNGVFGYNPQISKIDFDKDAAEKELAKGFSSFERIKLTFYFPDSLKLLGQYFKEQLVQVGIDVDLKPISDQQLQENLKKGDMQFYYMGWRHDTGDAISFLSQVVHSPVSGFGEYNGNGYSNKLVDTLIEKSQVNLNQQERLKDMQQIMKLITEDDLIGVPLFETESLFAYNKEMNFVPRVDSLVYPSQIKKAK